MDEMGGKEKNVLDTLWKADWNDDTVSPFSGEERNGIGRANLSNTYIQVCNDDLLHH